MIVILLLLVLITGYFVIAEICWERDFPKATIRAFVIALLLFGCGLSVFGQIVRWDASPLSTTPNNPPPAPGAYPPLLAIPGATIFVCQYTGSSCVTPVPTYTDITGATTCPSNAQIVQNGSGGICTSSTDAQGNFGFWWNAQTYPHIRYTVTTAQTTYGPYDVTAVASIGLTTNCTTVGSVQIYGSPSLICDPNVTINQSTHTLTAPNFAGATSSISGNSSTQTLDTTIYYADQYCTTPGTLDDTCLQNAINAVLANAVTGIPIGVPRHLGVIRMRPGVYHFNNTVTVPAVASSGVNLSIQGEYQAGIEGVIVTSGSTVPTTYIQVLSDNVDIKNIAFNSGANAVTNAITLGSSSIGTYDTHINWCWFDGPQNAIHIINGTGYDLSHNTFDSGGSYGIYSNHAAGDVQAAYLIATDLRGYGNIAAVYIDGDDTTNFGLSNFSGIFDHSIGSNCAVNVMNALNVNIQGQFIDNQNDDICLVNDVGVNVGPFTSFGAGATVLSLNGTVNTSIFGGSIINTGHVLPGVPTIKVVGSSNTRVHDVTSILNGGAIAYNNYGLSIDSTSTGSYSYANNFAEQTIAPVASLDATGVSPGCVFYPCVVAAIAPTTYTGTAGIGPTVLYASTLAAGEYRICGNLRVTTAVASATGTFQLGAAGFVSDGTSSGTTFGLFTPVVEGTVGNFGSGCSQVYIDQASIVNWELLASAVTGSPTVRYSVTLERVY